MQKKREATKKKFSSLNKGRIASRKIWEVTQLQNKRIKVVQKGRKSDQIQKKPISAAGKGLN